MSAFAGAHAPLARRKRRAAQRIPVVPSCSIEIIATGKRITLVVPQPTPSQNEFNYSQWHKYKRAKDDWLLTLRCALGRSMLAAKALGPRCVHVERRGIKPLDFDNLYGGLKCVIDGLRVLGLLLDDDAKAMPELGAVNVKLAKGFAPHSKIVLQDVD